MRSGRRPVRPPSSGRPMMARCRSPDDLERARWLAFAADEVGAKELLLFLMPAIEAADRDDLMLGGLAQLGELYLVRTAYDGVDEDASGASGTASPAYARATGVQPGHTAHGCSATPAVPLSCKPACMPLAASTRPTAIGIGVGAGGCRRTAGPGR